MRPADRIAPALTVTLTSAVGDRPVVRNNGEITLNVSSDEEPRRLPRVFFAEVLDDGSTAEKKAYKLGSPDGGQRLNTGRRRELLEPHLQQQRKWATPTACTRSSWWWRTTPPTSARPRAGTRDGSQPEAGDKADLAKLEAAGLLVEIDTDLSDPKFELAPETGVDTKKTESGNPFITIDFRRREGRVRQVHHDGVPRQLRRTPTTPCRSRPSPSTAAT